ncbi:MAG: hypothetical protein CMC13_07335 [Flavobacteriaceae bacterium]|nr:hypothetical protein [Flavobacteriaceae bacterium]|tara:strand:- start:144355 stop:146097 length:1743 start_codon:yes stop_codon:yes gene_type:complete
MKYYIIILILFFSGRCVAQDLDQSYLNTLGDEPLLALYDKHYGDSIALEKIARTYLDRARKQKDTIKMARGYDRLARTFHPEKNIAFADSVIYLTKNFEHRTYPAMGYFLKAYWHQELGNFNDYYINTVKGYNKAILNENVVLQTYAANTLVFYKAVWGDALDALHLQKETHNLILSDYYRHRVSRESRKTKKFNIDSLILIDLAASYRNFAHAYINLDSLDSAKHYNKLFRKTVDDFGPILGESFIAWNQATRLEILYNEKKYSQGIELGNSYLKNDSISKRLKLRDILIYLGLSQYQLNQKKAGIRNLERVDSIFEEKGMKDFFPYERLIYNTLLSESKKSGNLSEQIKYLNKLLVVDSVLKSRYSFFESNFIEQFERPKLLAEKEELISKLQKEATIPDPKLYMALAALVVSLCVLFYYFRKRLVYKKRFEELLVIQTKNLVLNRDRHQYQNELSASVIGEIMDKLQDFESNHGFLKQNITLNSLAKYCKTNSNYLSRVINLKIEKNFSQYLHELRIAYAMNCILNDEIMRKYTIKAIAAECGYKNAESFSKAFYKINGIYPSYYIKKIERGKKLSK